MTDEPSIDEQQMLDLEVAALMNGVYGVEETVGEMTDEQKNDVMGILTCTHTVLAWQRKRLNLDPSPANHASSLLKVFQAVPRGES